MRLWLAASTRTRPSSAVAKTTSSEFRPAAALAQQYLAERVLGPGMLADAEHIAMASVARVDVLVRWNFKHIVNLQRIHGHHDVNRRLGYPALEIRTPREVLGDE